MYNVIASEVAYLADNDLGFEHEADVVVALRAYTNQLPLCYASSGSVHAMHLMRHIAGHVQYYFMKKQTAQNFTPPKMEKECFGEWVIHLGLLVSNCEDSLARGAVGELHEYFMSISQLISSAMAQHGCAGRQGYEVV